MTQTETIPYQVILSSLYTKKILNRCAMLEKLSNENEFARNFLKQIWNSMISYKTSTRIKRPNIYSTKAESMVNDEFGTVKSDPANAQAD